jgi:hypothetical protein
MSNDVSTIHPILGEKLDQIRRARDTYSGTDAVKRSSPMYSNTVFSVDQEYLPKLSGQDKKQYQSYKGRAVFYGTMSRTVTALVGAIDRKPPEIKGTESIEGFVKDVTGTGISLEEFLKEVETEVMISGRVVVCVDRKNSTSNSPYLVYYKSEDCINWFTENTVEFDENLSSMIFKENYHTVDSNNRYQQITKIQYREFSLDRKGNVSVNIWRSDNNSVSILHADTTEIDPEYKITESYTLTNRGKPLGFIPCVPIVSSGSPFELPTPPLLDLVDVNLAHYRNSADYEHGMHWTALPTPVLTGLNGKDNKISIGSGNAIIMPDPQSKAMFLEFSGVGLSTIKTAMDHKEQMMSALGARMLASKMDQSTSAEVTRINYSGETASLSNVARSMSRGMTRLLKMVSRWENKSDKGIEVRLNEDYVDTKLAGPDIQALMSAYQGGALSLDSLVWNLNQGERLPIGRTTEDEIALIEGDMDREAEEALWYEDTNVGFQGNKFTSDTGSAETPEDKEKK